MWSGVTSHLVLLLWLSRWAMGSIWSSLRPGKTNFSFLLNLVGEEKPYSQLNPGRERYEPNTMCEYHGRTWKWCQLNRRQSQEIERSDWYALLKPLDKATPGLNNAPGHFRSLRDTFPLLVEPACITYYRNNLDLPNTYIYLPLTIVTSTSSTWLQAPWRQSSSNPPK